MTHELVIKQLKELIDDREAFCIKDPEHDEIYEKDIAALNYSIHAIDLTIPKKVPHSNSGAYGVCPCCERLIERFEPAYGNIEIRHCKWCGQKLNWKAGDKT